MIILGLTGSIAMGKSTVARQFAGSGVAVCDSDRVVHGLLGRKGAAVAQVAEIFPGSLEGEAINRALLAKEVFGMSGKLKQLEAILHPLVRKAQDRFIRRARIQGKWLVVLDIPLLFETNAEQRCDYTVVVFAPAFLQKRRVLRRHLMTEEKLARILARQFPTYEKIKRADFIVPTGLGRYESLRMVRQIKQKLSHNYKK